MRHIAGLGAIAADYDGFIVDLWGVVHDGIRPYPGALHCLERLAGRPLLLLSNAPRRSASTQSMLRRMGVPDRLYTHILTSGEATWLALRDRAHPWFARLGARVYHLGPKRDRNVLEALDLTIVGDPAAADFMLNTGPDDDVDDPRDLATFIPELDRCLAAGLPMICANPDLEVIRGGVRVICAGALAARYERLGGAVRSVGKPDPAIYHPVLAMLGAERARTLAVGDSLRTDIAGAQAAGIDSCWVLGGIHAESLGDDPAAADAEATSAGLHPVAIVPRFVW
jgi:HAD superfamily hydrolase (TIGR01459 family)